MLAGLAVWLGTPLLFYMYVAPPFSHACSAFAVALFVTVWLHVRERWTLAAGSRSGCGALMAMVREQDVFFALGPALDFLLPRDRSTRFPARWESMAVALAGGRGLRRRYLPQLLAYSR